MLVADAALPFVCTGWVHRANDKGQKMQSRHIFAGLVLALTLGACDQFENRTVNRAATGATIGAVAAALVSGNPLKGALVGGVVGTVTSKY